MGRFRAPAGGFGKKGRQIKNARTRVGQIWRFRVGSGAFGRGRGRARGGGENPRKPLPGKIFNPEDSPTKRRVTHELQKDRKFTFARLFKIPRVAAFKSFSWGNLYSYTPERFHIEISKSLGAAKTFQVLGFCPLGAKTPAPRFSKFPAFANFAKTNCSLIKPCPPDI